MFRLLQDWFINYDYKCFSLSTLFKTRWSVDKDQIYITGIWWRWLNYGSFFFSIFGEGIMMLLFSFVIVISLIKTTCIFVPKKKKNHVYLNQLIMKKKRNFQHLSFVIVVSLNLISYINYFHFLYRFNLNLYQQQIYPVFEETNLRNRKLLHKGLENWDCTVVTWDNIMRIKI